MRLWRRGGRKVVRTPPASARPGSRSGSRRATKLAVARLAASELALHRIGLGILPVGLLDACVAGLDRASGAGRDRFGQHLLRGRPSLLHHGSATAALEPELLERATEGWWKDSGVIGRQRFGSGVASSALSRDDDVAVHRLLRGGSDVPAVFR